MAGLVQININSAKGGLHSQKWRGKKGKSWPSKEPKVDVKEEVEYITLGEMQKMLAT